VLLCCLCSDNQAADSLEARLAPLAKAHKGKVALAVKHLTTGEEFLLLGDEPMQTASLIKFPLLIELYLQALEGKVMLADKVTYREKDKVPGSGILTYHFSDGATFSLRDAARLMIAFSDNTATNLVLDRIGIDSTNKRLDSWGLKETRINAKVYMGSKTSVNPARTKKYGLGSTTAKEMIVLLEKVYHNKVAPPAMCKEMIDHMKAAQDKDSFSRFLPAGAVVAHKTGAVTGVRTDAGILYLKKGGAIALCVLTSGNDDKRWASDNAGNVLCARVAQEVARYFTAKAQATGGKGKQ
jgi:beta-lactamase class A